MDINHANYDVIFNRIDPTSELKDCWGKLTPKLRWRDEYDKLWKRFNQFTSWK